MKSLRSTLYLIVSAAALALSLKQPQLIFIMNMIIPYVSLFGTLFLNALMMTVFPLILTSIILGVSKIGQDDYGKSLAYKVTSTFLINSLSAVFIGWLSFNLFYPFFKFPLLNDALHTDLNEVGLITNIFLKMFPRNIFKALADGEMIGLIVFCLMFGVMLGSIEKNIAQQMIGVTQSIFDTTLAMTRLIMKTLPIGIFCLVFEAGAKIDFSTFHSLGMFFLMVIFALFLYMTLWLVILNLFYKISPLLFLKRLELSLITAFTTSSSAVTLPYALDSLEEKWGVDRRLTRFMIPLGITINMSGTALFVSATSLYLARNQGISMTMSTQLTIVFTTWLTSFGIAGIPSGCLIALMMVLSAIGLPSESIGLIVGFDRLLDMFRTVCNIYANVACALVVACRASQKLHH